MPSVPTPFANAARENTPSKPFPVTPRRTRAGKNYLSISPDSGESQVSVPEFPLPPSSSLRTSSSVRTKSSLQLFPQGPPPQRPPPLVPSLPVPTEYPLASPSGPSRPLGHSRQLALDQKSLRRIQSNVNLKTYQREASAYEYSTPTRPDYTASTPVTIPTRGSSRHYLVNHLNSMSYSPAQREFLTSLNEGPQFRRSETLPGLIDEAADQGHLQGSETESIASTIVKSKGKAVDRDLPQAGQLETATGEASGETIGRTTNPGPSRLHSGESIVSKDRGKAMNNTAGKAAGETAGKAAGRAADKAVGAIMGTVSAQQDSRPDTQDSSTLVPGTPQSHIFFDPTPGQADLQRGATTTTITSGPSGRPNIFEDKIKRFKKWFQGEPSRYDGYDTDSSDLDPAMTCRGLPDDGILVSREVTVTSGPANADASSDPQPQENFISRFKTEKFIKSNGEVLDSNDESLQRYKQSLGLGGGKDLSDPNDPRVCIIHALSMETPGRDPVTIDLSKPGSEATLKDQPFKIKEGSKFTMAVTFKVQHEILSGLQYVQVVKRKGLKVGKDSEMLVSEPSTGSASEHPKKIISDTMNRVVTLPTPTSSLSTPSDVSNRATPSIQGHT